MTPFGGPRFAGDGHRRIPVAILGATGTVGQKLVTLLADHRWFKPAVVAASAQSAGKAYGDAVCWRDPVSLAEATQHLVVRRCEPPFEVPIVFSALDGSLAGPIEEAFARSGALVVTNAKSFRMEPDVPLLIPEVNPEHLRLLEVQRRQRTWPGGIIANPNCSTALLALALAPLDRAFGVDRVFVSTMQALSGAGYPGVSGLDALGNVIPYIAEEEEKIERESGKILGRLTGSIITPAPFTVSAHANRVPVLDGHLMTVSVGLKAPASSREMIEIWRHFEVDPAIRGLPSSPAQPIEYDDRPDRPQSRLDALRGKGMTVTVGRLRSCPILDWRFVILGHNLIRGAAGAAVQNAELAVSSLPHLSANL
jgi:aspartate-semialdehyde dehydrogenase